MNKVEEKIDYLTTYIKWHAEADEKTNQSINDNLSNISKWVDTLKKDISIIEKDVWVIKEDTHKNSKDILQIKKTQDFHQWVIMGIVVLIVLLYIMF